MSPLRLNALRGPGSAIRHRNAPRATGRK